MTTPERLQDVTLAERLLEWALDVETCIPFLPLPGQRNMAKRVAAMKEAAAALSGQQVPADGEYKRGYADGVRAVQASPYYDDSADTKAATPQAPQPVVDGDVARALEWVREVGAPFTQEERAMLDCIEEAIAAYDPSQVGARTVKRATEAKQAAVMYADEAFSQAVPAAFLDMLGGSSEGLAPAYISKYVVPLFTHPAPIDRDAIEILRAFERKFWQAVSMTDSRDFDHDVCKEVRDFRDVIAALAAHGKGG